MTDHQNHYLTFTPQSSPSVSINKQTMTIPSPRPRAALFICSILLLLASILTATLYSSILAFISTPSADSSRLVNFDGQAYPVLEVLPQNLNTASAKWALASSGVSIVVSSTCVIFAVLFWPDGDKVSSWNAYE